MVQEWFGGGTRYRALRTTQRSGERGVFLKQVDVCGKQDNINSCNTVNLIAPS